MIKRAIKVIKRNEIRLPVRKQIVLTAEKIKRDIQRNVAGVIDQWILERRANSRAERVFSDKNISAWENTQKTGDQAHCTKTGVMIQELVQKLGAHSQTQKLRPSRDR
jgi:hypothetical protein